MQEREDMFGMNAKVTRDDMKASVKSAPSEELDVD